MAWIVFWVVVGACGLAATYVGYRGRQNTEATIRHGIDKGVITDADAIVKARARGGLPWPMVLIVLGVVHWFAAFGVAVFAQVLGSHEPESVAPLMAIAAFTGFLALGLLVSGFWLRHALAKRD